MFTFYFRIAQCFFFNMMSKRQHERQQGTDNIVLLKIWLFLTFFVFLTVFFKPKVKKYLTYLYKFDFFWQRKNINKCFFIDSDCQGEGVVCRNRIILVKMKYLRGLNFRQTYYGKIFFKFHHFSSVAKIKAGQIM